MNDVAFHFPVVCFGEINWNFYPVHTLPGGAPLYLTYHLERLGIRCGIITRAGFDPPGKKLIELLESWQVSTDFFQLDNHLSTGSVTAGLYNNEELLYETPAQVAWDNIKGDNSFPALMAGCRYFVFGSVAARSLPSRTTLYDLLELATCRVLDLNLRNPHYSRNTIEYLLKKADWLKLNMAELELITGWFTHHPSTADRIKVLQERFSISNIVLTFTTDASYLYTDGRLSYRQHTGLPVADSMGSSAALLAGLLFKLSQGATPEEAHVFANAISAFVASKSGPCPDYHPDEISLLLTGNNPSLPYQK